MHFNFDGLLYAAHGSRVKEGEAQAKAFIDQMMQKVELPLQEIGFVELSRPTLAEAAEQLITKGAECIGVIPILLLAAQHAKNDIPKEIAKVKLKHPHVSFILGRPLGVHDKMIDAVVDRIREKYTDTVDRNQETACLFVGRGSSDSEQINDIESIARLVQQRVGFQEIKTCYLAAAHPSLREAIQWAEESNFRSFVIVPYLLFTGILLKSLNRLMETEQHKKNYIVCDSLGYHPNLYDVLEERIGEL